MATSVRSSVFCLSYAEKPRAQYQIRAAKRPSAVAAGAAVAKLGSIALRGPIPQLVNDSLVVLARAAQLLDVFRGDVFLALSGPLHQAKVCGLGVLELSFAPLLLTLEVFDEVHYELVYPVYRVVIPPHT